MKNRIKQPQEIEKKESTEEKGLKELAKDLARADDDGFAISWNERRGGEDTRNNHVKTF